MKILITTSGIGSRLGNITQYINKSLVKIGDKLAIDYIIDNYKHLPNVEFVITLGYKGDFVKQYLTLAYPKLINEIQFVDVNLYQGPGSSLGYSLLQTRTFINEPFIFHCCDAIFIDKINFNFNKNTLFVFKKDYAAQYSTVNVVDDYITQINEKGANIFDFMYVGVSYIKDYELFWNCLEKIYMQDKYFHQLSDIHVYMEMLKTIKFKFKILNKYFDIGNQNDYAIVLEHFKKKYNVLFKLRESISFHDDKVIKFFYDKEINKKRIERIKYLGDNTPKIYGYTDNFHSMELIDSKPLSEIYDNRLIYKLLNWANKNLWINIKKHEIYSKPRFLKICRKFYYDKTTKRIDMFLKKKLHNEYDIINGENIGSIRKLLKKINFDGLCNDDQTYFHGDFILDNILLNNNKFILIDWRQDFGGDIKVGDKYYDLAKLRHNIYFNHDNILNGLFFIKRINSNECVLDLKCNFFLINQLSEFNKFIKENKLNMNKVRILTAIIWINMAPLHEYPLSNFLFNFGKYNLYLANKLINQ